MTARKIELTGHQTLGAVLSNRLADFFSMVLAHGDEITEDKLFSLGEMVKNGGGKGILKLVEEARSEGRKESQE